jgi:enoyl-[acyl-carrier-protein] reductase (NADH)
VSALDIERQDAAEAAIRRILEVDDVAHVLVFLSSPLAAAITGESIAVDGGLLRGVHL